LIVISKLSKLKLNGDNMADWTPASVVLTGDQKTAAAAEGNSAKRLNLILASI